MVDEDFSFAPGFSKEVFGFIFRNYVLIGSIEKRTEVRLLHSKKDRTNEQTLKHKKKSVVPYVI